MIFVSYSALERNFISVDVSHDVSCWGSGVDSLVKAGVSCERSREGSTGPPKASYLEESVASLAEDD
jgi:hypothetical protein